MFVYLHTHRWINRWIIFSKWTTNKYMGKLIGFESMIKNYHMIVKQSVAVDVFVDLLIKLNPILASRQMRSLCDDMHVYLSIYTPEEIIRLLSIHDLFSIATATTSPFLGRIWICCIFSYLLSSYLPSMFIPIYIFLK